MNKIFCSLIIVVIHAGPVWGQPDSSGNGDRAFRASITAFKSGLVNKPIATFRLTDLDSKIWNSQELKGKVVVINFWFSTCKPCILEMPYLNELVQANQDSSVVFLALAPDNETQVKKFLKKFQFGYHIIPSAIDYINAIKVESFPTHFVIDKEGILRQVLIGFSDDIKEKLQREIDKFKN
jgi:thiol-disulfide isomerase/thioredoxin